MGIFPNFRGENKTYLKPPPRDGIPFERKKTWKVAHLANGPWKKKFELYFPY